MIITDDGSYFLIHPVSPESEGKHVIHKRSADISGKHECLFDPKDDPFPEDRFARDIFGGFGDRLAVMREEELTIELAVFADDTMWSHFHKLYRKDAEVELHRFIVAVVNNIDILFRHSTINPKVKVKIVKYEVLKFPPPSMSRNSHKNGDVDRLLESFCDYQHSINPPDDLDPRHWDHALLFSGSVSTGETLLGLICDVLNPMKRLCNLQLIKILHNCLKNQLGLHSRNPHEPAAAIAFLMCQRSRRSGSYLTNPSFCLLLRPLPRLPQSRRRLRSGQRNVLRNPKLYHFGSVFVVTHEMGHSLGMYHDGLRCCIMSPSVGTGKTEWSQCSVKELNVFVTHMGTQNRPHNCLRDDPLLDDGPDGNSIIDRNVQIYPGQDYPINEQCMIFHGECWKHELRDGQTIEDVCQMVWCGNNEGIIRTAHPALEGTYCGEGRFCIGGKCVPATSTRLRQVHGKWSEWNEMSSCGMGCSDCSIDGQLRVRRSVRTCDSPSPNNGGQDCPGAALRGIRCHRRICKGPSIQEFSTKVCTQYRNHPVNPLPHLTGKGFQYEQAPCKIWCFMSRNNIRTISNFPDGTPCGSGKYCVQGECMSLACNGKSLVNSTSDCPLHPPELSAEELAHSHENQTLSTSAESHYGSWSSWSAWTVCTATLCNSFGVSQRTRTCSLEKCIGSPKQRAVCRGPVCVAKSINEWTNWSACSASCGANGVQHRSRTNCKEEGFCLERRPCAGLPSCSPPPHFVLKPTVPSHVPTAPLHVPTATPTMPTVHPTVTSQKPLTTFVQMTKNTTVSLPSTHATKIPDFASIWSEWSSCSTHCGIGIQKRSRKCQGMCLEPEIQQTRPCRNESGCLLVASWAQWTEWSNCSASCGQGFRQRIRKCNGTGCLGSDKDMRLCIKTPCKMDKTHLEKSKWRNWTLWSGCSNSCGGGLARRYRICHGFDCAGPATEYRHCGEQPCPLKS
ncbi:hypothetical protein L596_016747 [Steinernema carpocapsae]|nr:hypothetical protein L596_016747 [Steinernema carpocapsae]